MDNSIVIKVKYGDTLRRFNSHVGDHGLDMEKLRAKVISFFNFTLNDDITLTYIDDDDDVVTLANNDDLSEAMRQNLNPLRINVLINSEKGGQSYVTENFTTLCSALENLNSSFSNTLKSLPEPIQDPVSKLYMDFVSKAASSVPVLAEEIKFFSSVIKQISKPEVQFSTDSNIQNLASGAKSVFPQVVKDSTILKDAKNEVSISKDILGFRTGDITNPVVKSASTVDLNLPLDSTPVCTPLNIPQVTPDAFTDFTVGTRSRSVLRTQVHRSKRSHKIGEIKRALHVGVICDGCEVHPISGPRYKSQVIDNYDLCSNCFSKMGNEKDYVRLDRPLRKLYSHSIPHSIPYPIRGRHCPFRPELDSRFVLDVNVVDGTVMPPSTKFTKIWKMHNSGCVAWPPSTKLVWIGGDKFSETLSVPVDTVNFTVPIDMEVEIAVNCIAPEIPGRYISYWRMSLPSGKKFGQRVWVLIEIKAFLRESLYNSLQVLDLNLPPESTKSKNSDFIGTLTTTPLEDGNPCIESVERFVGKQDLNNQELNFPINDTLLVGNSVASNPVSPTDNSSPPLISVMSDDEPMCVQSETILGNSDEEILLSELVDMGFTQVDLNKKILKMNEFNLEQSVDDLCSASEWDTALDDLEDMGFCDTGLNVKLLRKNNGSIKRVVMELIAGEKPDIKEKTQ